MLEYVAYSIAPRGLATSFTEAELPDLYATAFVNRFINAAGGAEKRQGIVRHGAVVPGAPEITGLHEMLLADKSLLFASALGKIYRYESETSWKLVYADGTPSAVYKSVQMGKKLIFYNGVDRNIFTEDGETFRELKGIIERGIADSGTTHTGLAESDISDWRTVQVATNDLVYNKTQDAYGIITLVSRQSVTHTPITTSAVGIGRALTKNQAPGDVYEVIDLVELNVIPTGVENDNVAVCTIDSPSAVAVAAVPDWTKTEVRPGDFVRNTTKNWVTQVTAVTTTQLLVVPATSSAGDSLVFMKHAMPIAANAHVHFGRAYYSDARDLGRIVISGPDNPEDLSTDAGTLDSTSISFSSYQPTADRLIAFASFQRFLALCGVRNIYLFEGTTPIIDATTKSVDFTPVGLFPQGVAVERGAVSIGNDLVYVAQDGIQAISLGNDSSVLSRDNLSEPLKNLLRDEIAVAGKRISIFHYPKRAWLCAVLNGRMYVYNYTPYFGAEQQERRGSWSVFDGLFAQQTVYLVTSDGTLYCAGAGGKVYKFDQGTYTDDGVLYNTVYRTGWLSMEPRRRGPVIKQGHYIQPVIDAATVIEYEISVEAPFDDETGDRIKLKVTPARSAIGYATVGSARIGGVSIFDQKQPLRWRGKEARFTFTTRDDRGPDILSRFIVFITRHGAR